MPSSRLPRALRFGSVSDACLPRSLSGFGRVPLVAVGAWAERAVRREDVTNGHITFQAIDRAVLETRRS
jgi:hypothetical protein